jgi:hypothetical protein
VPASHRDADLLLRLHQLRQNEPYRTAARHLERELRGTTWAEVEERAQAGSDGHDALRVVLEHWELVGAQIKLKY